MLKKHLARSIAGLATPFAPVVCRPVILYGHGVAQSLSDRAVQSLHIEAGRFERQIRLLQRSFQFLRLDDLLAGELPNNAVCLTFDDGYRNNLTVAAPILRSLGVPFAVYVSTGHLDSGARLPTYVAKVALRYTELRSIRLPGLAEPLILPGRDRWREAYATVVTLLKTSAQEQVVRIVEALRTLLPDDRWAELDARFDSDAPMSWAEAQELQRMGADIGGHCHDHAILHTGQPAAEIERQVAWCHRRLVENGFQPRHFAFPNGTVVDIAPAALQAVQAGGFLTAATTIPGSLSDSRSMHLLPRIALRDTADATVCHVLAARLRSTNLRRWQAAVLSNAARLPSAYRRAA